MVPSAHLGPSNLAKRAMAFTGQDDVAKLRAGASPDEADETGVAEPPQPGLDRARDVVADRLRDVFETAQELSV